MGEFIQEIDKVFQSIQLDAINRNEENVFTAYMVDFTWKVVQVKIAFMVRQLNFKVATDLRNLNTQQEKDMEKKEKEH